MSRDSVLAASLVAALAIGGIAYWRWMNGYCGGDGVPVARVDRPGLVCVARAK